MKRVFMQLAGSESQAVAICIQPRVTAGEIVRELKLHGFCLFVPDIPPRFFHEKETLYEYLTEGQTVYATVLPEVATMYLRSLLV
jgi:hypothetical protein